MPLTPGFTRFRGEIMLSLEATEMRRLLKLLRHDLRTRDLNRVEETVDQMLKLARDSQRLRAIILDLYEAEWKAACVADNS